MKVEDHDSSFRGHVLKTSEFAGLRLLDSVFPAKTEVPTHSHDTAFFCIALTGLCNERFAGKQRRYEASEVEFLPADQCHTLAFPFADTRAFSINIDRRWIERAREFSLRLDNSVQSKSGPLGELMIKIYDEFTHPDSATPMSIEGLMMEMLVAVGRHHSQACDRRPQRWLERAMELLRESFTEHVSLTEVATAAGVHPVYLAREFRRFHGCTVGEYVRQLRVELAARHLRSSDDSLATIAVGAGFSDQSHFSRTFKRVMGMTPARYRESFGTQRKL